MTQPTVSKKALKKVVVLRIGLNPTRSNASCYNTTHASNNTYTKMNLSTVKWAQWDKTHSRELLGPFICVCIALCTIVAHNIAQNRPDNFPSYPPDNHHCSDDAYLREGCVCVCVDSSQYVYSPTVTIVTKEATVVLTAAESDYERSMRQHDDWYSCLKNKLDFGNSCCVTHYNLCRACWP